MEDYKVQVNYKLPDGTLINIRAQTTDELSVLLEGVGDYATQISATGKLLNGVATAAPLSTQNSTTGTAPLRESVPTQAATQSAGAQKGPMCQHGQRKYKSGISAKTGNPYAMWVCPQPQTATDQCKPVN